MYLIAKFFFEPVNDRFYRGTANSIRRLKLEQNGRACPDHFLHHFGIVHERRLTRMHDDPGGEQACDDHAKGEEIIPFWVVREQYQPGKHNDYCGKRWKRVFGEQGAHLSVQCHFKDMSI